MNADYISELDKRRDYFLDAYKSAGEEFDKQVVYLSGGGLVLTIGFVKNIVKLSATAYLPFLLLSWILFAATLLLNLWSHKASAASTDPLITQVRYLKECHLEGVEPNGERIASLENATAEKRKLVSILNATCVWLSVLGVISFIIFTAINVIFHA